MRILLLEPSENRHKVMKKYLLSQGFLVDDFFKYTTAMREIDNGYNGFIIGIDSTSVREGMEFLKSIRSYYPHVPVLMLYLEESLDVRILKRAYALGCDDVLKKPFLIEEIDKKLAKLLNIRRDVVHFGAHGTLDFSSGVMSMRGVQTHFSTKERRLLSILFSNKGHTVSFETIQLSVWDGEGASVESIRSLVRRVRQKIPFVCIKTIVNVGYILKLNAEPPLPQPKRLAHTEDARASFMRGVYPITERARTLVISN